MNNEVLSRIFYTPVANPDEIRCIEVKEEESLEIIDNFVKKIVNKKLKKPLNKEPRFKERVLIEIMEKDRLKITLEDVKHLFEELSKYMYGRAREERKYWCLILTQDYLFIYHFTPERAISFEGDSIKEFIKYLDDATLLKFIFKVKREKASFYFEELSDSDIKQILNSGSQNAYGVFDKNATKGMKELLGEEPEYEFKGQLRVRIKRTEKTDIVIETFLEDLKNIKSSIDLKFEEGTADIHIEGAPITELNVEGKKYDVATGLKRINYEELGIGKFMTRYKYYKNYKKDQIKIVEHRDCVKINDESPVNKPEIAFKGKERTIFILGEHVDDYEKLIEESSEELKNNLNIAFVELNRFNASYDEANIGFFTIYAKFKEDSKRKEMENTFNKLIENVSKNLTLTKTLHYLGLLALSEFLKSREFREKISQIGRRALSDYYLNMPKRNIELKEIDKLGIEFKAGIRADGKGFLTPHLKSLRKSCQNSIKEREKIQLFSS